LIFEGEFGIFLGILNNGFNMWDVEKISAPETEMIGMRFFYKYHTKIMIVPLNKTLFVRKYCLSNLPSNIPKW
jgi:hypothetical protein